MSFLNFKKIPVLFCSLIISSSFAYADYYNMRTNVSGMITEIEDYSCNDILNKSKVSLPNGVYEITNGKKYYDVYCDMNSFEGGWTLVLAQFESNPADWNEGIQGDYDPSLGSGASFALNTSELPSHSKMSMGYSNVDGMALDSIGYFNFVYSTGNIAKTLITLTTDGVNTGSSYHIHRNTGGYYASHDPEDDYGTSFGSSNTLTIDRTGGKKYSFAYSVNRDQPKERGYAYKDNRVNENNSGAWMVWVK